MTDSSNFISELEKMAERYNALSVKITDPDVIGTPNYNKYLREYGSLEKIVKVFEEYRRAVSQIEEDRSLLEDADADEELREMAREEIAEKEKESAALFEKIKDQVYSEEAGSDKIIVEIRAGTGGEEASLFAADLFRMYSGFCERKKLKLEIMDTSMSDLKGFKSVVFSVKGPKAYNLLQYESGGHRVQRVPVTESGGRIHTSAATVAVLPEAEDVEVTLNPNDLEIETFRSSGPGGQSVNTMDSAVRITHKPTGIVASCQDGKSQLANKDKAMRILKTRIYETIKYEKDKERGDMRKQMIGSGDRNERIRTYNFPQNRITDHRIEFSLYSLELVMTGELDEIIEKLHVHFKEKFFEEYVGKTG